MMNRNQVNRLKRSVKKVKVCLALEYDSLIQYQQNKNQSLSMTCQVLTLNKDASQLICLSIAAFTFATKTSLKSSKQASVKN